MKTYVHLWHYLSKLFLKWRIFQTKVVQKIKTHILYLMTFFIKLCLLWENMEKYCAAGQTTDYTMARAHCMLYNWGYKHTLRICNAYPFFILRQQFLHERASVLRFPHIGCLVLYRLQFRICDSYYFHDSVLEEWRSDSASLVNQFPTSRRKGLPWS